MKNRMLKIYMFNKSYVFWVVVYTTSENHQMTLENPHVQ